MNSCLYDCTVIHHRKMPAKHSFRMNVFSFYLDLDELDLLEKKFYPFFGYRKRAVYRFLAEDHLNFTQPNLKEAVIHYLQNNGVTAEIKKVYLLTNLRTFGYVFNPVSYYFCEDDLGRFYSLVEVGNTFGEFKPYIIDHQYFKDGHFNYLTDKFFYISPFVKQDCSLRIEGDIPGDQLRLTVNSHDAEHTLLFAKMMGKRHEITRSRLAWMLLKYRHITFKVISRIHWHAFRLMFKKVHYIEKDDTPHFQKNYFDKSRTYIEQLKKEKPL